MGTIICRKFYTLKDSELSEVFLAKKKLRIALQLRQEIWRVNRYIYGVQLKRACAKVNSVNFPSTDVVFKVIKHKQVSSIMTEHTAWIWI